MLISDAVVWCLTTDCADVQSHLHKQWAPAHDAELSTGF